MPVLKMFRDLSSDNVNYYLVVDGESATPLPTQKKEKNQKRCKSLSNTRIQAHP